MSPVKYHIILKYRLMIPLFSIDEVCHVYRKACLNTFGEHVVHCKELVGLSTHTTFWGCTFRYIQSDPLDRRSTLKPADVMVYEWVRGKHACVDLTKVSPLVGLGVGPFTVGQAALKAASSKVAKHEKSCSDNEHAFIPFALDTFGFLAPEAVDLLHRVQKIMHSNVVSPRSMNVVFMRIDFAIQKGLAA